MIEVKEVPLGQIKPYEKNPRKNREAVDKVAASIKAFGFKVPLVIDADGVIVCGHTRYAAAKQLKLKTAPVIIADDLTDDQIKAFRIVDNRTAEFAEWDVDLLTDELQEIERSLADWDLDIDFDTDDENADDEFETNSYIERITSERFLRKDFEKVGKYEFALIRKQDINLGAIPDVVPSKCCKHNDTAENRAKCVVFFVDDYDFVSTYTKPEIGLKKYKQYAYVCTPDFSMYSDMPLWRQLESVAWNRWVGAYWQAHGLKVIPTVGWCFENSYEFCFDAIEEGSVVAVTTMGNRGNKDIFLKGYNRMLEVIKPEQVLCYCEPFPEMEGNITMFKHYRRSRER